MADIIVYDKAKWHYEHESYPADLPEEQGAIYCGFALAWFCVNDMLSEDMLDDWEEEIEQLKSREVAPVRFEWIAGGSLVSDMLDDAGNRFAAYLFESEEFDYYELFEEVLALTLPSPYLVADTWRNYELLAAKLDEVYKQWQ